MQFIPPETGAPERVLAEDQPQYQPLTVAIYQHGDHPGAVLMLARLRLTEQERQRLYFDGEDLFISELCFPSDDGAIRFTPLEVQVGMQHFKVDKPIEERPDDRGTTK